MLPKSPANAWFTGFCQRHQIAVSGDIQQILELAYTELAPPVADRAASERVEAHVDIVPGGARFTSDDKFGVFTVDAASPADRAELAEAVAWLKGDECNVGPRSAKSIAIVLDALARSTDAPSEPVAWEYSNGFGDKFVTRHDPDCWHNHDRAGFKDFRALVYRATPPAATTSTGWAMSEAEYDRMVNGLMAQLGEISEALEISEEDQSCANGNDAILAAIEDLKQPAATTSTEPVTKEWCVHAAHGELDSGVDEIGAGTMPATPKVNGDSNLGVKIESQPAASTSTETPVSTPCASGEGLRRAMKLAKGQAGVWIEWREAEAILARLAATQAPAVPATRPKGAGYFKHDAKRGWTQVNPADWILPGVVPLYFADGRTPTAGNTEDARSMGAVSEGVPWQLIEIGKRVAEAYRDGSLDGRLIGHLRDMLKRAEALPTAARDVLAERRRQVEKGRTPAHDDEHDHGEIAEQAAVFLMTGQHCMQSDWAWKHKHPDSPERKDRRTQLVMGTALALAEIERYDRAALTQAASTGGAAS